MKFVNGAILILIVMSVSYLVWMLIDAGCIETEEELQEEMQSARIIDSNWHKEIQEEMQSARIIDSNWHKDPTFTREGIIKWNVQVKNISSRYIRNVEVEFSTYETNGRMISTDFTYVSAIPPGESRATESYADLYGTESRATLKIVRVHFAY